MVKHSVYKYSLFLIIAVAFCKPLIAQTGTWVALPEAPDNNGCGLTLLTDGRVMCHTRTGGQYGTNWDILTPDSSGSYINGIWSDSMPPMAHDREFFSSQTLVDGRVYIAGGENGHGGSYAEVYDPLANTWTATGPIPSGWNIYDGNSEILYDGTVLEGPQIGAHPSFDCMIYSPTTNLFTVSSSSPYNHDEAAWLKLPDSSVLFVGINTTYSTRYVPQLNKWVYDDTVPVKLYDPIGEEAGAALMLPNGKAIFFGATGHNAMYAPSGDTNPGKWTAAADFPMVNGTQVAQVDAPAAMMVNGKILCAASPLGLSSSDLFRNPVYFFEYDYVADTFVMVTANIPYFGCDSMAGFTSSQVNMIDLPDGNVLVTLGQTPTLEGPPPPIQYFIYQPATPAIAAGKPTLSNIYKTNCTWYITGMLFNGISEGAGYGDDWQMETNYPIVRIFNGTHVYYGRTTNWNRIGAVQTGTLLDTAQFTMPPTLSAGTYSVVVVVNGFVSDTLTATFDPFEASIGVLAGAGCPGNLGNAQANTRGGIAPFTYAWSNGNVVSVNNPTGPMLSAGTYTVTVTDSAGCTATARCIITQPILTVTEDTVPSSSPTACDGKAWVTVSGGTAPYTYLWISNGSTTDTIKNLCKGNYCCIITDNAGCTDTTCVNIIVTGISSIDPKSHINIFPNPASSLLTINGVDKEQSIELINSMGQRIMEMKSENNPVYLNVSGYANGVYLVRILNNDASLAKQIKIVKTK